MVFAACTGSPSRARFSRFSRLFVIGVGIWLLVTSVNTRTETVTARVSKGSDVAFSHADNVDFEFADGSEDNESSPPGDFFDAVEKFGPGPARVTRNTENDSIYKVAFHGKTYTIRTPTENRDAGIIAVVLGLLGLVYVILASRAPREPSAATAE